MIKKSNSAFSIVELLIIITIISLISFGISRLNFNTLSYKQHLEIFVSKMISNIELIQNNSLLGRTISASGSVPDIYKIHINNIGSGGINTEYSIDSGVSYQNYIYKNKIVFGNSKHQSITSIECLDIDNNSTNIINGTGILSIEGGDMSLAGGCGPTDRTMKITLKKVSEESSFSINTLNGIITKK